MDEWQKARNGSEFMAWENVPDEIKALLQNDDLTVNFEARVTYGGYVYNATEFRGKVRVFRQAAKSKGGDEVVINNTNITEEAPQTESAETTQTLPVEERAVTVNGNELVVSTLNVTDFVAVKVSEVKAKLAEGYQLFGTNFNEAYRDGLVGMVKYQQVPLRVA